MSNQRILYQLVSADGLKSEIKELDDFCPEIRHALNYRLGGTYCQTLDLGKFNEATRTYEYQVPEQVLFVTFKEKK